MFDLFLLSLILTGFITRFFTYRFHIIGNDLKEQKTLTGYIRRKVSIPFTFHHIHFGILLLLIVFSCYIIFGKLILILLGISLSLIMDQIFPLIFNKICYFSRLGLLLSILGHLIIITIYFFITF